MSLIVGDQEFMNSCGVAPVNNDNELSPTTSDITLNVWIFLTERGFNRTEDTTESEKNADR